MKFSVLGCPQRALPRGGHGKGVLRSSGGFRTYCDRSKYRLNFGYFLIEIEGLMRTDFVGESVFKNSVRGWVNKYYVNSSYASADGGSSIAYRHAGTPTTIGSLRVRILDPDGTMATVGPDNTVFVELIPAPPPPKVRGAINT